MAWGWRCRHIFTAGLLERFAVSSPCGRAAGPTSRSARARSPRRSRPSAGSARRLGGLVAVVAALPRLGVPDDVALIQPRSAVVHRGSDEAGLHDPLHVLGPGLAAFQVETIVAGVHLVAVEEHAAGRQQLVAAAIQLLLLGRVEMVNGRHADEGGRPFGQVALPVVLQGAGSETPPAMRSRPVARGPARETRPTDRRSGLARRERSRACAGRAGPSRRPGRSGRTRLSHRRGSSSRMRPCRSQVVGMDMLGGQVVVPGELGPVPAIIGIITHGSSPWQRGSISLPRQSSHAAPRG